jgi:ABC-2 type transport system ATP-binding protein
MILGLLQPDAGDIHVLGTRMSPDLFSRIGYLPEERGLYRDVRVIDCLVYLAELKGLSRHDARRRTLAGLDRLGLSAAAVQPVKALSRGMQQKVQFLSTILHEPELLVIDEPFSGLDPVNARLLRDLLLELHAGGCTIVMSTHQMSRVEELCDRMLMLQDGGSVLYGDVRDVRQRFSGGTVVVNAEGDLASVDGVAAVTLHDGLAELTLLPGTRADDLFRRLAARQDIHVTHFEVRLPSLEEIFVTVAGMPLSSRDAPIARADHAEDAPAYP